MKRVLHFTTVFFIASICMCGSIFGESTNNLALNKPAYANASALDWAGPASYANDGNFTTRWQSTKTLGALISAGRYENNSWWMVDLQSVYNINGLQISWEAAYAVEYTIQVSTDSITWDTVFTESNGDGAVDRAMFSGKDAKYVKIVTTVGNMQYSSSLYEVEVYEKGTFPMLDNYSENFNKGIPSNISYAPKHDSIAYILEKDSVSIANYALKISGPLDNTNGANLDPIVISLDTIGNINLSKSPYIYFRYKADSSFSFKITAVDSDGDRAVSTAKTIYTTAGWLEYRDSITIDPTGLDTVVALELNINSTADVSQERVIYIDDLKLGAACPPYQFAILKPQGGTNYKVGDSTVVFTNAIAGNKVKFLVNDAVYDTIDSEPYMISLSNLTEGLYKVDAFVIDNNGLPISSAQVMFTVGDPKLLYRDKATEILFTNLKALSISDYMMFGVANGLTISYSGGPKHGFNDKSDSKDITGSHPAFIESDFMWYNDATFKKLDTAAMRVAYNRGAVCGYCYHLNGKYASTFYLADGPANKPLVKEIIANADRTTNASLEWYLNILDKQVIPVVKGLGFPMVYRPFHEMTGGWFWWGTASCTPQEYVKLFRLTVDYLRSNGVRNLLYAWAPDKSTDMNFYPGDDYVDVIGYDGYDVGVESYHSIPTFVSNVAKLADYAATHDKVAAVTETGYGKYPSVHYDFWLKHILEPLKKNAKARKIAWVMTWYNADWSNNKTGTSWIPYSGIDAKTNGQNAINDFMGFYNDPSTIFLNDVPSLYSTSDSSAYVYPAQTSLLIGDSLKLIGGMVCNWINDPVSWSSNKTGIVSVSSTGKVKAIASGIAVITVTASNGKTATSTITVTEPLSVNRIQNTKKFSLYPNPSYNEKVCIDLKGDISLKTITVFNIQGEQLLEVKSTDPQYYLSTERFSTGLYLINIKTPNYSENQGLIIK